MTDDQALDGEPCQPEGRRTPAPSPGLRTVLTRTLQHPQPRGPPGPGVGVQAEPARVGLALLCGTQRGNGRWPDWGTELPGATSSGHRLHSTNSEPLPLHAGPGGSWQTHRHWTPTSGPEPASLTQHARRCPPRKACKALLAAPSQLSRPTKHTAHRRPGPQPGPAPSLTSCVTLDRLPDLSTAQFPLTPLSQHLSHRVLAELLYNP